MAVREAVKVGPRFKDYSLRSIELRRGKWGSGVHKLTANGHELLVAGSNMKRPKALNL